MNKPTRRTVRLAVIVAGVAALGGILSGTAFAAPFAGTENNYPDCERIHPKHNYSLPGHNGYRDDDWSYGSEDYQPECHGFHGDSKDNGYNGHNGTDDSGYDDSNFQFAPL